MESPSPLGSIFKGYTEIDIEMAVGWGRRGKEAGAVVVR